MITITDYDSVQTQVANTKEPVVKKPNTQQDNPLLKMFQKMREKNVSLILILKNKKKIENYMSLNY